MHKHPVACEELLLSLPSFICLCFGSVREKNSPLNISLRNDGLQDLLKIWLGSEVASESDFPDCSRYQ